MNALLLTISFALVVAQFALPRRLAFLPLLIAACHTPYNAELAGNFTAVRLVLIAGLLRAGSSGLLRWTPQKRLDLVMLVWSGFALLSAFAHDTGNPFLYRAGLVLNCFGTYLYARAYIRDLEDVRRMTRALVIVLIPLAALLVSEVVTGANAYRALGARLAEAVVREDRNRAMGPFGTAILAGTLGSVCFPFFVAIWRTDRRRAQLGILTCLVIIAASASSGPIGTLLIAIATLGLWWWRTHLRYIRIGLVIVLLLLHFLRERPVWFILARIDFVGGSTGWHRAQLIDASIKHLDEWWLLGTDHTRHWMPFGLWNDPNHVDLTSYYVHLGVIGGLPLTLALIAIVWQGFLLLGRRMRALRQAKDPDEFLVWCVGAALMAHAITFLTISYFDQIFVFFYVSVAVIQVIAAQKVAKRATVEEPVRLPPQPAASL